MERLLTFGRELQSLYTEITQEQPNRILQTLLQDSFSLLAYKKPQDSPVSYLLEPSQRESDTAALNSAILGKIARKYVHIEKLHIQVYMHWNLQ